MGPENRKFDLNRSTFVHSSSPLISELSGYMDLGMHRKAVPLAIKILKKGKLTADEFDEAIDVLVCSHPKLSKCIPLVLGAYQRLNMRSRKTARHSMLSFYYHLSDYPKALLFVSRNPNTAFEFVYSLETYMELELEDDAIRLASRGRRIIKKCKDALEQGAVLSALATFFTRQGDFDKAIMLWQLLPNDISLGFDKFESIVKLNVAKSIQAIQNGLRELQLLEMEGDPQFEIAYPGLHQRLIQNIRKQLHTFSKSLEGVISKKDLVHYGLN
jgi:hypothetical protein